MTDGRSATTVVLVDDDLSVRRALRRLLASVGYDVAVFASVDDFLTADPRPPAACLIVDLRMPGRSGFDLQDVLLGRGSDVPIIFISGDDTPATEARATLAGAAAFLPKPIDAQALLDAIERATALRRRKARDEQQRQ